MYVDRKVGLKESSICITVAAYGGVTRRGFSVPACVLEGCKLGRAGKMKETEKRKMNIE
jgi:hypothetical protein